MENQGPGLLMCDEELFSRVWNRVTTAEEGTKPAAQAVAQTTPQAALAPAPSTVPAADATGGALQRWTQRLLADSELYRGLSRRARQGREELAALGRGKRRQARELAAEYFLRTGVRYWPENSLRIPEALPFFPSLRALYLAERDKEAALRAQAAEETPELANRYLAMADAARAAAHQIRGLIERNW